MTDITTDPAILAAAEAVAKAELAAADATDALRTAEAKAADLRAKLHALESQRRAIGERRAAGDVRIDDAGELALIAADHEALSNILNQREAEVLAARAAAERAVSALGVARHALDRAEWTREENEVLQFVTDVEKMMIEGVDALHKSRARLGGGLIRWLPSPELTSKLRTLESYNYFRS